MILVAGATGSVGGRIVRGLLDRGDTVRALVRPASRWQPLRDAGAAVAFGDLREPDTLERACAGATVLITTASATKTGDDSIENVDLRGNQDLFAAAQRAGIQHVIFVSTLNASPDSPAPVFRAKGLAEQALRESGVGFTIVQPDAYMDVWFPMLIEQAALSHQPVTLVGESRRRHSFIAEADVAAFAIAAVRVPAARNATLVIGGPQAISFRDVVQAYERAAGRPIELRSVAPGEPIPGVPEPVWGIAAALERSDSVIPMEETARTYGVTLTSVQEFTASRLLHPATP